MRQLPDSSVDLVFTSPPYNIRTGCGGGRKTWEGYDGHADNMPHSRYVKWQRECLQEMMRLIPDTGAIFYNHCHRVQNGIMQSPLDILGGFPYRQAIIWERSGGINHNPGYFLPTHEMIYLIAKPGFRLLDRSKGTVWKISQERTPWIPGVPAFPIALPQTAIAATDARIVLDPFMGSGTTAAAAKLEGRHYIGIEKSERYCRAARERVSLYVPGETLPIPPSCYEQIPPEPEPPSVGKSARIVYDHIASRIKEAESDGTTMKQAEIASATGLSRPTVERAIKELKCGRWIQVDWHGRWADYSLSRNDGTSPISPRNDGTSAPPGMMEHRRVEYAKSPRNDGTPTQIKRERANR